MTVPYLIANPPRIRQFRERGTTPSGVVVVHTAESTPDWVGPDAGAEAVARFIQQRTTYGSYHDLADSDSIVNLVPYPHQAYGDGTGSNPHAYHVSAATQAAKWGQAPADWREATVVNMAKAAATYARWLKAEHEITIPARRVTKAQSDNRVPGFIAHGDRDPGRRTDPGAGFPWPLFLDTYAALMNGDDMPYTDWPQKDREALVRDVVNGFLRRDLFGDERDDTPADSFRTVLRLEKKLDQIIAALGSVDAAPK